MPDDAIREKMGHPSFPANLTESEWRRYVMDQLERMDRGFGAKLRSLRDRINGDTHGGIESLSSGRQPQGAKPVRHDQQGGGTEQPGASGTGGRGQGKAHEQGGERDLLKANAQRTRKRKVMPAPPLWRVDPKR